MSAGSGEWRTEVAELRAMQPRHILFLCVANSSRSPMAEGEEVCPVFLGKAHRVHWGFPDPTAVTGTEEIHINAFRSVRDELLRRLKVLFGHGEET
ncbi:hypothetical protein K0B90_12090 [bacterium]|nr:hypothetical protein [bacterium]